MSACGALFLHRLIGGANCVRRFALAGRLFFCTDPAGCANCVRRISPLTNSSFSAPADRGTRTALAGSPLSRQGVFAEPQRGIRRLRTAGRRGARARGGGQKEGHLRFPFLFGLLPFPCFPNLAQIADLCDRFRKGRYDKNFFLPCLSQPIRRVKITYCYTDRQLFAGCGITVPHNSSSAL